MDKLFLKEFTYHYILLHDNLTKDEKIQIGEFVKEASEEQVMALLLSGKCKTELREREGEFVRELFEASPAADIIAKGGELLGKASKGGIVIAKGDAPHWIKNLASKYANLKVQTTDLPFGQKWTGNLGAWNTAYDQATTAIKHGAPVAALVMATLVTLVATKVYKSYISKAGRACKGQASSELKKACMRKYAIDGLEMKVRALQSGIKACDSAKDPGKCKDSINLKIEKTKTKILKMKAK